MVVKKLLVFVIVLLCSTFSFAQYEHEYFTGDQIKVTWDPGNNALGHEWKVTRVDDHIVVAQGDNVLANLPTEEQNIARFVINSAGIYTFYLRSWNYYTVTPPDRMYSEWVSSLTHGKVDGVIRAWQIKVNLRSVGPLLIYDEP